MYQNASQIIASAVQNLKAGKLQPAEAALHGLLSVDPGNADAMNLLGTICCQTNRAAQGVQFLTTAISLKPEVTSYHSNLAEALRQNGQLPEALQAAQRAIQLNKNSPEAHFNLGTILTDLGQFDAALQANHNAIQLKPDYYKARKNQAFALFIKNQMQAGWMMYESSFPPHNMRKWSQRDLKGKSVLVMSDQGFGDTIQFARYLPDLVDMGAHVIFSCQKELFTLLQPCYPKVKFHEKGDVLPHVDIPCPIMCLPILVGLADQIIPQQNPVLKPEKVARAHFKTLVKPVAGKLNVGISWSGNPKHRNDLNRSIHLSKFMPLSKVPNINWYSLQKGPGSEQVAEVAKDWPIIDLTDQVNDFNDSAGIIKRLDLVITIDSAMAHLAGAMDKKVWTLLPFLPDWRWLLDRSDTLWYPSMQLFRQPRIGDWDSAIQQVANQLQSLQK